MHADFLVELGTEELPPKSLKKLSEAFAQGIKTGLSQAGLQHGAVEIFATPRRLAVGIKQLPMQQPNSQIAIEGPPTSAAYDAQGQPTPAALGFAKKWNIPLTEIDRSGSKLRFVQEQHGQATASLLPKIVEQALLQLPIAKRMRWGSELEEFVRPTQWLLMLLGDAVVPAKILTQTSDRITWGHRFHCNERIAIANPKDYEAALKNAKVVASFKERCGLIEASINAMAEKINAQVIAPSALLDEVTALVEWPVPLMCQFEERFLTVPQEALITTMQENQKYFCLTDSQNKLLPKFIAVSNIESVEPQRVTEGNEKVVRPRLKDAEFFYEQDQRIPLADRQKLLEKIVFQSELGTLADKSKRLSQLTQFLAITLSFDSDSAKRAGELSKCDLTTMLVTEFPDMQGLAGTYYAKINSEPDNVAQALKEQYMPRVSGGELPQTQTGMVLAIADKLDTMVGIFGVGQVPSGSKDPFALRRSALGILRILIEKKIPLDLSKAIDKAIELYGNKIQSTGLHHQLMNFIFDRLRARYDDLGVDPSLYLAVKAHSSNCPLDFDLRLQSVSAFAKLPEAASLIAVNKRVMNILEKSQPLTSTDVQNTFLREPAEMVLHQELIRIQGLVTPFINCNDYTSALTAMVKLNQPANAFFDSVMVNVEDTELKQNRLALLTQLRTLLNQVADVTLIGSGVG